MSLLISLKLPPVDRQRLPIETTLLFFFALLMFGAKIFLINQYGNATPFWDQWDAEAASLYKPYLEGNLSWSNLLAPHNEHRIFTTRILAIILLELNGGWNPLLQMVVNAAIHVTAICLIITLLLRVIGRQHLPLLLVFAVPLFSVPYAWENTLAGFQSQFYFVLFFGTLCLWLLTTSAPLSSKWWLGTLAGLLAFLSLASGLFAIAAATCVMIIQYVLSVRRSHLQLFGILLLSFFIYLGFSLTPTLEGHEALKAQSFDQFIQALRQILTWPEENSLLLGGVIYLPALMFGALLIAGRPQATDKRWFLLAAVAWCVGQCVSLAYGRATGPTSSRYLDLVAIGLLVNFSVVLSLTGMTKGLGRYLAGMLGLGWLVVVVAGLTNMFPAIEAQLTNKKALSSTQEINVRQYLCDGNSMHLQGKPMFHIPYPDANRLQRLLDDPSIRKILPRNIYTGNSDSSTGPDGAPLCLPKNILSAYSARHWSGQADEITVETTNVRNNDWQGGDYLKSQIDGLKIIGSLVVSDSDTGYVLVHIKQGDKLLYRTGPVTNKQAILVGAGRAESFHTEAPSSSEWSLIEFKNENLPAEFDVMFIDAGTGWGEWSAIAVVEIIR